MAQRSRHGGVSLYSPGTKEAETGGSLRVQGHHQGHGMTHCLKKKSSISTYNFACPRTDLLGQAHKSPCPSPTQLGKLPLSRGQA